MSGGYGTRSVPRVTYVLTGAVIVLTVVASVVGIVLREHGIYDPEPRLLWAFVGQDAMNLAVGVPLLVLSARAARRGSSLGRVLWMAGLFYVAYAYCYAVFGARFNALYLAYVALVTCSFYALVSLAATFDPDGFCEELRASTPVRPIAAFLIAMALLFAILWTLAIGGALASGAPIDPVLRLVVALDFLMPLPAMLIAGVLLWRRAAWGYALAGVMLVKAASYGLTLIVCAALVARATGALDPLVGAYVLVTIGASLCLALLLRGRRAPPSHAGGPRDRSPASATPRDRARV